MSPSGVGTLAARSAAELGRSVIKCSCAVGRSQASSLAAAPSYVGTQICHATFASLYVKDGVAGCLRAVVANGRTGRSIGCAGDEGTPVGAVSQLGRDRAWTGRRHPDTHWTSIRDRNRSLSGGRIWQTMSPEAGRRAAQQRGQCGGRVSDKPVTEVVMTHITSTRRSVLDERPRLDHHHANPGCRPARRGRADAGLRARHRPSRCARAGRHRHDGSCTRPWPTWIRASAR